MLSWAGLGWIILDHGRWKGYWLIQREYFVSTGCNLLIVGPSPPQWRVEVNLLRCGWLAAGGLERWRDGLVDWWMGGWMAFWEGGAQWTCPADTRAPHPPIAPDCSV